MFCSGAQTANTVPASSMLREPPVGAPSAPASSSDHVMSAFARPTPRRVTEGTPLNDVSGGIHTSDSNVSTASESNVSNSSSSKSGNNSASSTDSVIFRPSSCDELDSDTGGGAGRSPQIKARPTIPNSLPTNTTPPLDHISSLRKKQQQALQALRSASDASDQSRDAASGVSSRTDSSAMTSGQSRDDAMAGIRPMQPMTRNMPYSTRSGGSGGCAGSPALLRQLSLQQAASAGCSSPHSASSRLGVNRPLIDPAKLISHSMRRTVSNGADQSDFSDAEPGYDVTAGYMSDGDILKSKASGSGGGEMTSGYVSEGGASEYAKRLQQRSVPLPELHVISTLYPQPQPLMPQS